MVDTHIVSLERDIHEWRALDWPINILLRERKQYKSSTSPCTWETKRLLDKLDTQMVRVVELLVRKATTRRVHGKIFVNSCRAGYLSNHFQQMNQPRPACTTSLGIFFMIRLSRPRYPRNAAARGLTQRESLAFTLSMQYNYFISKGPGD